MIKLPRPEHSYVDYEMDPVGKLTIGAMLVEAATNFIAAQQRQQHYAPPPPPPPQYRDPDPIGTLMAEIDAIPGLRAKFDRLSSDEKIEVIRAMLSTR